MANPENKQIPYESTQKDIRDAIESVATAIGGITHPDAEDIVYDNSGSGLSATDVQNAIDELSSEKADSSSLATVATSGDYDDLINKPTIPTVNDATLTIQKNGSDVATFTANASSNVTANVTVPTTTSELTNNSDFVSDASYVHTDNNFTNAEKTKLGGIESGAEVNVQSDWSQTDNTADDYIKNKPSSEVKSATDTFTTVNGGLLEECVIDLVPVQSGSGDPSPDNVRPISGHTEVDLYNVGKNKLPLPIAETKSGITLTRNANGSVTLEAGTATATTYFDFFAGDFDSTAYAGYLFRADSTYTSWSVATISFRISPASRADLQTVFGNSDYVINNNGSGLYFAIRISNGTTIPTGGVTIYPMLRKSTETDPTFEPYQGKLYQVQIGSTVYGGYVDLVSGVMNVEYGYIASYNGETINEPWISDRDVYVSGGTPTTGAEVVYTLASPTTIQLTPQQIETLVGQNNLSTPLSGQSIDSVEYREVFAFDDVEKVVSLRVPISMLGTDESGRTTASQAYASGDYFYKDGYMCKALTSISAGATLTLNTNYEYSTLDEILESKVDKSDIYANAGSHNSIYRGKYLGSSVTAKQWTAIQNGTFEDLFIGDYWTINSVNWRIAHFDYWLGTGDTECTTHHVVIVPDTNLYGAKMNSTDTTTGGYYNSEMRGGDNYLVSGSSNLYSASETIKSAFGSSHILTHREMLTNAVSSGNASGWDWYDSSVELMSEVMVYGTVVWSVGGKGYEVGIDKEQLALFRHDISKATNRSYCWLRGVNSASNFAMVINHGNPGFTYASNSIGVRPAFAIK